MFRSENDFSERIRFEGGVWRRENLLIGKFANLLINKRLVKKGSNYM